MPHIPAEASGAPGAPTPEEAPPDENRPQVNKPLVPKLALGTFNYPIDKIIHALFGVKVQQNEYTKELEQA